MCYRVDFAFNKMIRLGYFKFPFDKMLKGNNKVSIQRYLERETPVQGHCCSILPASSKNTKEASVMWVEGWVGQGGS